MATFLCLCFGLLFSKASFSQIRSLDEPDFSIKMDRDWYQMRDFYIDQMARAYPSNADFFINGYALRSADEVLEPPYFFVTYMNVPDQNNISFDTIVAINQSSMLAEGFDSKITIDQENLRFYFETQVEGMTSYFGLIPGAEGSVYIHFYKSSLSLLKFEDAFLFMFNSVEIKDPYVGPNGFGKNFILVVIGLTALLIVGIIVFIMRKNKLKRTSKNSSLRDIE